jgi:hypothetical protein
MMFLNITGTAAQNQLEEIRRRNRVTLEVHELKYTGERREMSMH